MTDDEVKALFPKEMFDELIASGKGTKHLFFGNGGIDIVRHDKIDGRDPRLWIAKYKQASIPPYELILTDISHAISEYKREDQISRGGKALTAMG